MSALNDSLTTDDKKASLDTQIQEFARVKKAQLVEAETYYRILNQLNKDSCIAQRRHEISTSNMTRAEKRAAEAELRRVEQQNQKTALKAMQRYTKNILAQSSADELRQYYQSIASKERAHRTSLKEETQRRIFELTIQQEAVASKSEEEKKLKREIAQLNKELHKEELASIKREHEAVRAEIELDNKKKLEKLHPENYSKLANSKHEEGISTKERVKTNFAKVVRNVGGAQAELDRRRLIAGAEREAAEARKADIQSEMSKLDPKNALDYKRLQELQEEFIQENKKAVSAGNKEALAQAGKAIASAITSAYKSAFQQAENMLTSYEASMNARLQGSDKSYDDMTDKVTSVLSVSPFVKSTTVLEKLKEATDLGIVYNIEQRAFLAGIADKISNTFDAFDSNLLRLIRLQQADTTAARLGMEASLLKFFNNMFNDNSYLKEAADAVSAALIEASATMDKNSATEFEYIVQKWLGSLSSLGMDNNTVNTIAKGINYLATGDVTSLANSSSLQTLFAMSAANANIEYSEILLKGLDANTTNDLLRSMVEYLKTIAEESENNVVRAAYSDIFDLSVADMRAISNLTTSEISQIHDTMMSYSNMENELNTQLKQIPGRMSMASMLQTIYENVVYGVAADQVSNPATWGMQKMLDFMVDQGVNVKIPFINAMGFGLDLNAGVTDFMRIAVGASQATSLLSNIFSGLGSSGGLNLNSWEATEYNSRGGGFNFSSYSTIGGKSGSTFVSNSSSSDMNTSTISSATDDAEETGKITNKNHKPPEKTTDDFYAAIIGDDASEYVKIRDDAILRVYEDSGRYLRVHDNAMSYENGKLEVIDSALNHTVSTELRAIKLLLNRTDTKDNVVQLAKGTTVDIKKDTLVSALNSALYGDNDDDTLATLIKLIKDGNIIVDKINSEVPVKTEAGTSLNISNLFT